MYPGRDILGRVTYNTYMTCLLTGCEGRLDEVYGAWREAVRTIDYCCLGPDVPTGSGVWASNRVSCLFNTSRWSAPIQADPGFET